MNQEAMSKIPGFGPEDRKRQELLSELIRLRNTDYDTFMERMFEALNTVFMDDIKADRSREDKIKSLDSMIKYFSDRDEFEKCQKLVEIKNYVNEYHESDQHK